MFPLKEIETHADISLDIKRVCYDGKKTFCIDFSRMFRLKIFQQTL